MVYLVVAVILLHIISIPIVIKATVKIGSDSDGTVCIKLFFIPVFKKQIDAQIIKSELKAKGEKPEDTEKSEKSEKPEKSAFLIAVAKALIKRIRVRDLVLNSRIGTGNAASSAVAVGIMRMIYGSVCALLFCEGKGEIAPEYETETVFVDFSGIISLCIADIIYAVFFAIKEKAVKSKRSRKINYASITAE